MILENIFPPKRSNWASSMRWGGIVMVKFFPGEVNPWYVCMVEEFILKLQEQSLVLIVDVYDS
jgi:hypothetical protein